MEKSLIESTEKQPSTEQSADLSPIELLLHKVNGEGRFQIITFTILALTWFLTSWLLVGMSFFFDSTFACAQPYTDANACSDYVCGQDSQTWANIIISHSSSIVFQFKPYLICDKANLVPILQSMLFFGSMFGFLVIPYIADNAGRKISLEIAWGIAIGGVVIILIADSSNMIGLGLFFIGFGTNPATTLSFSFINEQCLGKYRQRFNIGVLVSFSLGEISIGLIFSLGLSWRTIMLLFLFICLAVLALIFKFILESHMFLVKKNPSQALAILNQMAKINHRDPIDPQEIKPFIETHEQHNELIPQHTHLGIADLFRFRSLRWISISSAMIYFGLQNIYYASSLNAGSIGFSQTINQVIFGMSELLGYVSVELIMNKIKRKRASYIGVGISVGMGFVLGVLVMLQNEDNQSLMKWIETGGLMINRFILCAYYSIFFVYLAEMYPTEIRSLGLGWVCLMGVIGSAISPFVSTFSEMLHMNSWFLPAILGGFGWIFIFCLPETLGQPLKDVIVERIQNLKAEVRQDLEQMEEEFKQHEQQNQKNKITSLKKVLQNDSETSTGWLKSI